MESGDFGVANFSPTETSNGAKAPKVGVTPITRTEKLVELATQLSVASCDKVIVAVPAFPNLIAVPFIAAIVGSLEVALHFPVDCELGYAIATSGSPANFSTFAGAVRLWRHFTKTETLNGFDEPNLSAGLCTAVTVTLPGFSAVNELPLIDAIAGSDDVNVHAPVEFETGAANEICCGVPGTISMVRSRKPDAVTTGSTAKIVTFSVTIMER